MATAKQVKWARDADGNLIPDGYGMQGIGSVASIDSKKLNNSYNNWDALDTPLKMQASHALTGAVPVEEVAKAPAGVVAAKGTLNEGIALPPPVTDGSSGWTYDDPTRRDAAFKEYAKTLSPFSSTFGKNPTSDIARISVSPLQKALKSQYENEASRGYLQEQKSTNTNFGGQDAAVRAQTVNNDTADLKYAEKLYGDAEKNPVASVSDEQIRRDLEEQRRKAREAAAKGSN